MSVFYDVLMEKSAQKKEREDDKGLFGLPLTSEDAVGAISGGGAGYIGTDMFYRPKSDKNYYRKRNIARGVGLAAGVPLGIAGDRAIRHGVRRTMDSASEESSPIYPALTAAGGTYLGHVLDQRRAQREYEARVSAREEKAKPLREAYDKLREKMGDAVYIAEHGDTPESRAFSQKIVDEVSPQQKRVLDELGQYIGTGDKPQRLYRGKLLGAAIGAGLGYGAKRLYDRSKRGEQR